MGETVPLFRRPILMLDLKLLQAWEAMAGPSRTEANASILLRQVLAASASGSVARGSRHSRPRGALTNGPKSVWFKLHPRWDVLTGRSY